MIMRNEGNLLSKINPFYPWLVVACGMAFYCFNYFLRVSPSVMQADLTQAFHINATEYGTLAAFYYYAYTSMQVPAGMIYDKFGVRLVLCFACLTAVCGLTVFVSAESYAMAAFGRLLIGLGCAFAYIGTLKLASIWLPATRFGMVAGLTSAIGMVSGTLSQTYLTHFVETVGYQAALKSSLIFGVILSIILFMLIRNKPVIANQKEVLLDNKESWAALKIIISNPQMWLIGTIGCLLYLPSSVFLDLWGIPYLKEVYHMTSKEAVTLSSFTFYGWILASPIIGAISDKIKRRRSPLIFTGVFAAILLCSIFYLPNIDMSLMKLIFFFIGFSCGAHSLAFALGKESNPIQFSGTAVAVTNMLIMLGGVIFLPVVGKLLDLHTQSPLGFDGLPIYSASDYTFALSIVPIGVTIGVFLCLFLKETYCEPQRGFEEHKKYPAEDVAGAKAELG